MSRDIIEKIGIATAERPIKGFALDQAIYIVDTKQEALDAQAISNERVAKLVVWARDIAKWMVFNEDGSNYDEKDMPSGDADLSNYVEKYKRADLDYLRVAYGGKYNDDRVHYPAQLNQDSNGWTHLLFTGYMQFQSLDKATGDKGDVALELRSDRVINKVQPYYNDYKLAVRANSHIANTSNLSDMITADGISISQWINDNPEYTPPELLEQIFTSKVVGFLDWQGEITLSAQDYNGTLPNRYGKWVIRRSNDSTRNYMYVHVKESKEVYRAPYIAGANPVWSSIAYISDIDEIVNDRLGAIFNPSSAVDITLKDLDASDSGYDIAYGSFDYVGDNLKFPRWDNTIAEAPHYNGLNASYILFRVEDVARFLGRDLDQNDNELGIDLTSASGGLGQYSTPLPINAILGAKWDYRGRAITDLLPTNPDGSSDGTKQDANNPNIYLKADGSTTENGTEAKVKIYTPHKLKKQKNFFGRGWGFALRRGYVKRDKTFSYNTSSNYYVCVFDISNAIAADKHHTFNFTYPEAKIYESVIDAEMASDAIVSASDVSTLVESNNDTILTPDNGVEFQLIDADKASGYGDNGFITYYPPNYSTGQVAVLADKLDNSKSYFIHSATSSSKGFLVLHESYVSQIYNKDVTGISELTMLFGPKSRGRYAKNNQTTPEGMVLNWNGEYLPDTEDANDLNPSNWIAEDGSVTQSWSSSGIKTACYSSGVLANSGSALLQRGDVFCDNDNGVKTSRFVSDSDSEFFVIPVRAGGGTFNDLKIFPFFMSRFYKTQNVWESYTFDKSADAIGTLLRISYDAAIEIEEAAMQSQEQQLLAGIAGGKLFVNEIQAG